MIKLLKKIIGKGIRLGYRLCYRLIPCQTNTVLFISFHGRGYSDNPKALHEYMSAHCEYAKYRCIWAIKNHKQKQIEIPNAKVIEYFSLRYFYYLARSKVWIVNCKLPNYVLKKEQQIYLQTWHGTPLKRLAHDIDVPETTTFYRSGMSLEEMKTTYDIDVKKYTYMISPSMFTTQVFPSAFQIEEKHLIETGYPRNDALSTYQEEDVLRIKQEYGIPLDKKVILYAPTWRDNSYQMSGYTFTLEVDFKRWKELLGDEYIILFKPHYLIVNSFSIEEFKGFVYFIEPEKDIRDAYIVSDILITDYSSVFFDYAILKRPIYFYMYDLEEYGEELRGFYLDIYSELPGEIMQEEEDLLQAIVQQRYDYSYLEEFNKRFNTHEDGNASKRVLDIVFPVGEQHGN